MKLYCWCINTSFLFIDEHHHSMDIYEGETEKKKPRIIFWRAGPLQYRLPPLGECARNPSVSVYQLALLWEAALGFSEFFFLKTLSLCLSTTWWVIYEHTCTMLSVQQFLTQNSVILLPHAPYSPNLSQSDFFCFPGWKKSSWGNVFADVEEGKQKMAEELKRIKIDEFKNCFEQ